MTTTDPAAQAAIDLGDDPTSATADIIRAAYAPLLRQAQARAEAAERELDQCKLDHSLLKDDYLQLSIDFADERKALAALRAACAKVSESIRCQDDDDSGAVVHHYGCVCWAADKLDALLQGGAKE